ncbi:MAG: aromatic ring-hydroxylating dioxygenase subunit alpha [Zavarzinia sp.]|nr:aromatic ring-hydroxylating dioxygenase subunit alpha [Zavarzinia sp.]
MYLRNHTWYVADWGHAVTRELRQIEIMGEKIVIYRNQAGDPVALEDACPHRKLPLSMGRLKGDQVECGYHGLTFDCSGACTRVPGQSLIPAKARVRSYPVVQRYDLVWIWMGDPALADPDKILKIEHWGDPSWGFNTGPVMELDCNYLLVTDNLLDPSHVSWVHPGSFAQAACEETPLDIDIRDDGVTVSRWMHDVEVAPLYQPLVPFTGNCDRLQHYEVRFPSLAVIKAVFTPAGKGGRGKPLPDDTFLMDSYNLMTPVNERQTRYFWFQLRNVRPDCAETSAFMSRGIKAAFDEDKAILNAVQKGLDSATTRPIDLAIDGGPLRFRRLLDKMIAAENTPPGATGQAAE